jgi:cellulose synthase/poly-beta-1,6-N-acetylglucosamine synthase-like glycosyltransferase
MLFVFAVSIGVVAYAYALYPAILVLWAALRPRPVSKSRRPVPVSIVLAVRDEERRIEERLADLLAQNYPPELIEVVVISDGSKDRTAAIAGSTGDPRVRVIELESPVGKAQAVNVGLREAAHEVVVFTDARQRFSPTAVLELTANFSDDSVGGVSGELVIELAEGSEVGEGVGLYWSYEKLIRRKESEIDSVVGASGSIYAIRKRLFSPLPPDTLLDDFLIPMRIVLQGFRVVFERQAKAYDRSTERSSHEFARKVRTLAGNFQAMALERSLLNPARNRVFFQMASHKLTRLIVPYFLVAAFASNLFLEGAVFRATMILQALFYFSVLLVFTPLASSRAGGLVRVAWTFFVMNAAAVVGLWVVLVGREKAVWKKPRN